MTIGNGEGKNIFIKYFTKHFLRENFTKEVLQNVLKRKKTSGPSALNIFKVYLNHPEPQHTERSTAALTNLKKRKTMKSERTTLSTQHRIHIPHVRQAYTNA